MPIKSGSRIEVFVFIAVLTLGGYWIPSHFSVTLTPSLANRVYYVENKPDPKSIKKGDYVIFVIENELIKDLITEKMTNRAIKMVGCTAGSSLRVDEHKDYFCGDELLGRAKDFTLRGHPVNNFIFAGIIPAGKLFVIGQHKDSFDSRYFGFLNAGDIIARAYPIF